VFGATSSVARGFPPLSSVMKSRSVTRLDVGPKTVAEYPRGAARWL